MARTNTRRMHALRAEFFEQGKQLAAKGDPAANCWLCGLPVDYDVAPNTTPDSHNLDHVHPVSQRPDLQEDPDGWRHAHRQCNQSRGNRNPSAGLGAPVDNWW